MQEYRINIPSADVKFFKEFMSKMGWRIEPNKKRRKANAVTMAAIKEARTKDAVGIIDTSSYDAFVKSILQ